MMNIHVTQCSQGSTPAWTDASTAVLGMPVYTRDRVASLRAFSTVTAATGFLKGAFPGTATWRPPN